MVRYEEEQKTIGIIVEELNTDFPRGLIYSVINGIPENKNIRIVVLAGKQEDIGSQIKQQYCKTYNSIYYIEEMCRFDGLIVALTDMFGRDDIDNGANIFYNYQNVPKIYVATEKEGEVTVNYDNEMGIREAIECLVNINGVSKICMLGGRSENADAVKRKEIFKRVLNDCNLPYSEDLFETTDMLTACEEEADRLLDRNPDVGAVFCVNDQVAVGLYRSLKKRGLVPGKDVYVFGFDNSFLAGKLIPPLASIGSDSITLGQKAIELLIDKMEGKEVESVLVPTRLHGRDSFKYETYDYSSLDLLNANSDFIYRMFDDCFYRYKDEFSDSANINLRRLFFEVMSRLLTSLKNRYLSEEEYIDIERLIDIFFENGGMAYTDAAQFTASMTKIQGAINYHFRFATTVSKVNRLLIKIRDCALRAQSDMMITAGNMYDNERKGLSDFLIEAMNYQSHQRAFAENIVKNFGMLGFKNAALYLFKAPRRYEHGRKRTFPESIYLKCVVRDFELYIVPPDRQKCPVVDVFKREELSKKCRGYVAFPIFYNRVVFGILVCELTDEIPETGEYIADQLGRSIHLNYTDKLTKQI